jgi:hypothetical protein
MFALGRIEGDALRVIRKVTGIQRRSCSDARAMRVNDVLPSPYSSRRHPNFNTPEDSLSGGATKNEMVRRKCQRAETDPLSYPLTLVRTRQFGRAPTV